MRTVKAGVLGGIVLFIWGMVSWMLLPWHMETLHSFKDAKAVTQVIESNVSQSGIYFAPTMEEHAAKKEVAKKEAVKKEPMIFTSVRLEGMGPSMAVPMLISLFTQIVAAFFVAWMLSKTIGLSYMKRVTFVVVFALAASLVTEVPAWTWFGFDPKYVLVLIADLLIGWFFAGLVLAKCCGR